MTKIIYFGNDPGIFTFNCNFISEFNRVKLLNLTKKEIDKIDNYLISFATQKTGLPFNFIDKYIIQNFDSIKTKNTKISFYWENTVVKIVYNHSEIIPELKKICKKFKKRNGILITSNDVYEYLGDYLENKSIFQIKARIVTTATDFDIQGDIYIISFPRFKNDKNMAVLASLI